MKALKITLALIAVPFLTVLLTGATAYIIDIVVPGIGQYEYFVNCPIFYIVYFLTTLFGGMAIVEESVKKNV